MTIFAVRLPDVGEGIAEAELVEWHVAVGDRVTTESVLAEVLTDKATVEISSPVAGVVTFLHGTPGESLAVGTEFVGIELDSSVAAEAPPDVTIEAPSEPPNPPAPQAPGSHAIASPAVRKRARELQIELSSVAGTGPAGQILHTDLDRHLLGGAGGAQPRMPVSDAPRIEPVRGLRRRIAERLTASWSEIPHITYVEEVDATDLEVLRAELNRRGHPSGARLTMLPFIVRALTIAISEQPRINAWYDAEASTLSVFDAVHVGIAAQTPNGLVVPVVRHAETQGLWDLAAEIARLSTAAREGTASRDELGGSTITITSLGALGGIMTTPLINKPEVAIIGINKLETRPVWRDGTVVPRSMFNLSSSFDHRIVDGWDAAVFVQRIRALLEMPALLFLDATE